MVLQLLRPCNYCDAASVNTVASPADAATDFTSAVGFAAAFVADDDEDAVGREFAACFCAPVSPAIVI